MANEITIPILPCRSVDETLEFYRALGFAVISQQSGPNNYAVVKRGDIELHFFSMKDYDPANSYSTCYVRVTDVDGLYQVFMDRLRQKYGRIPSAGIPRVIPLKDKTDRREFIVVDPGGNWIRIGTLIETPPVSEDPSLEKAGVSKLSRATHAATLLSEAGQDIKAAAMLDVALAQEEQTPAIHRVHALVVRAGLAITMEDWQRARQLLLEMRRITLNAEERQTLSDILERANEFEFLLNM